LDLFDGREAVVELNSLGRLVSKLVNTVEKRQTELEMALAQAHGVPVRRLNLVAQEPVALWNFQRTEELIETGYVATQVAIAAWPRQRPTGPWSWLNRLVKK
jgi:hypothetical protein